MNKDSVLFFLRLSFSEEEIEKLHKKLNGIARQAQDAYYNSGNPIMSDKEYDDLYDFIEIIEAGYPVDKSDSVTQTAGIASTVSKGKEETHEFPCLSQDKTKDPQELLSWLNNYEGLISRKCDGLTLVSTYDGGKLTKVVSRGDGTKGLNVTEFAKTQNCILKSISDTGHVVVRGEYLFTFSEFERINKNSVNNFSHPRNLASGTVNTLDLKVAKSRQGEYHVFELVKCSDFNKLSTYEDQLNWCKNQGFKIAEYEKVDKNNLLSTLNILENSIKNLDYPTDGLVLRINDNAIADKLGYTGHAPRFSIAFKFKDDIKTTHLRDIIWQASRSGRINPVALFDPVDLDGAMTSRATLNNIRFLEGILDKPYVGQELGVIRANLVIPTIVKAVKQAPPNAKLIEYPKTCPSCGHPTRLRNSALSDFLVCDNPDCPAKQSKGLEKFASKACMNIEGMSTKIIEDFIEAGFITKYSDFYKLENHKKEIIQRPGYGQTSYDNIIASVNKSKNVELYRFISGLGIPNVSNSTAKDICKYFNDDFNKIRNADEDDFMNINGIGMTVAVPLVKYFRDYADEIDELLKFITFTESNSNISTSQKLQGKSFCITGSLNTLKNRDEFISKVEANGGKYMGSVRKGLDYLVTNDPGSNSSKNKAAQELGIQLITEQEFLNMII